MKSKAKPKGDAPSLEISNVTIFNGIKWEGLGIETLNTVAKGLLTIAELFKAQSVQVEAGIKVVQNTEFATTTRPAPRGTK